ncbi:MAG: hypothetical protein WCS42_00780 [Verrucomicrobiota bacterium]
MKTKSRKQREQAARRAWYRRCIVAAMLMACGASARADGTNTPAVKPLTPQQMYEGGKDTYTDWVELSTGGLMTSGGSTAQAQQQFQLSKGVFGGISDLHIQQEVAKKTTLTLDGHALFDQNDYKVILGLSREELGYVKFTASDFRTWYNGAGGYYPPTRLQYNLPNDALSVDRGEISVEAGLTLKDMPQAVFKYTHSYRDGDKSSTIWGPVHPNLTTTVAGVFPSIYSLNEKVDSYALDLTHHINTTDFGLGVRYDTASLADTQKETFWSGETQQRDVTNQQGTSYDMFNVHAFSETWLKKNLFFSTGYSFANLDDNFSGNRVYGDDFDVAYSPNNLNGMGYTSLNGGAHKQEHVVNVNLMTIPLKNLTIVPSLRVQQDNWNANSTGMGTLSDFNPEPFTSNSDGESLDLRERLDIRYTGITNWVHYCGAELTEGNGDVNQTGGLNQVNGYGPPPIQCHTDDTRFFQKYFVGTRWYPYRRTSIDLGGYYKNNQYNYNNPLDSTYNGAGSPDRYPAYLTQQNFQTYDGNIRLTLRPAANVMLVSRYEYQWSTINTTPDAISGLNSSQSSTMTSQIIGQNASWSPWSRLCLQAGFNYVLSETKTPTSDYTQAVLNSQNNYWTVTFNSAVVLDDKTDLNLTYLYYQASDYNNNSADGLPLGAGAQEHTVTAGITRRINPHLRVNVKCAYSQYNDWASGGNNNTTAEMVYTSLQYRF